MRVVLLLLHLLAGGVQLGEAGADDVVTAVGTGVVDRFVLAHECQGDGGGQAAERAWIGAGIDVVPCAGVGEAGLEGGGLERRILGGWCALVCTCPTNCDMAAVVVCPLGRKGCWVRGALVVWYLSRAMLSSGDVAVVV